MSPMICWMRVWMPSVSEKGNRGMGIHHHAGGSKKYPVSGIYTKQYPIQNIAKLTLHGWSALKHRISWKWMRRDGQAVFLSGDKQRLSIRLHLPSVLADRAVRMFFHGVYHMRYSKAEGQQVTQVKLLDRTSMQIPSALCRLYAI